MYINLNMKHIAQRWIVMLYGMCFVFIGGYMFIINKYNRIPKLSNVLMWNKTNSCVMSGTFQSTVGQSLHAFELPDINSCQKCFQVFSNTSYLRSVKQSQNRPCRLVTHRQLIGRVGNQMFQVAAVVGIANDLDMIPVINLKHSTIAKYFNLPNKIESDVSNVATCNEEAYSMYSNCLGIYQNATLKNISIDGYRQSWKYFARVERYIRIMFQFKEHYIKEARLFIASNSVSGHDNVCIHVRRGDFLQPQSKAYGYAIADNEFISKAMQFYERKKLKRVRFVVLSDDMKWCINNLKGNVTFSPYKDPGIDLAIMSLCDHVIVTSGTFGWWGAWLSNGTVVYFHGFPRIGSKLDEGFYRDDYYPRNWIKL